MPAYSPGNSHDKNLLYKTGIKPVPAEYNVSEENRNIKSELTKTGSNSVSEQSEMSITVEFPMVSDPVAKAEFVDRLKHIYLKRLECDMAESPDMEEKGENHE